MVVDEVWDASERGSLEEGMIDVRVRRRLGAAATVTGMGVGVGAFDSRSRSRSRSRAARIFSFSRSSEDGGLVDSLVGATTDVVLTASGLPATLDRALFPTILEDDGAMNEDLEDMLD